MSKKQDEWYFSTEPLGGREWPVTTRQLANYLQVTTRTLATWRAEGRIPYWRLTPSRLSLHAIGRRAGASETG